jgi:hypothetical protein
MIVFLDCSFWRGYSAYQRLPTGIWVSFVGSGALAHFCVYWGIHIFTSWTQAGGFLSRNCLWGSLYIFLYSIFCLLIPLPKKVFLMSCTFLRLLHFTFLHPHPDGLVSRDIYFDDDGLARTGSGLDWIGAKPRGCGTRI